MKNISKIVFANDNYSSVLSALEVLHLNKPKKRRLRKAAEECSELTTALLQHINKGGGEEHILEEAIDVLVNIEMILMNFTPSEILEMYNKKITKFLGHKDLITYSKKQAS